MEPICSHKDYTKGCRWCEQNLSDSSREIGNYSVKFTCQVLAQSEDQACAKIAQILRSNNIDRFSINRRNEV